MKGMTNIMRRVIFGGANESSTTIGMAVTQAEVSSILDRIVPGESHRRAGLDDSEESEEFEILVEMATNRYRDHAIAH